LHGRFHANHSSPFTLGTLPAPYPLRAQYPDDNWNLYQHIDRVEALNATVPRDAGGIFKPFARRLEVEPFIVSDSDEELLIKVYSKYH